MPIANDGRDEPSAAMAQSEDVDWLVCPLSNGRRDHPRLL
jgi:hypothetical protein